MNENPGLTTVATAIIIIAAIVFIVISMLRGGDDASGAATTTGAKEFFSDDDGKSYFTDDRTRVPPFERNGKTAYRARVFTCDGGANKFVGYLERYTPQAKKMIEDAARNPGGGPVMFEDQSGVQYKKPGTGEKGWVSGGEAQAAMKVREVLCPNGSPADPVLPD